MNSSPGPSGHEVIRELFLQEMRALELEGTAFSEEYPEAAGFLNAAQIEDRDPTVERLTEGFAYLCARVRQTVAEQDDGLVAQLLELLADEAGRTLPSVVVVQATSPDTATDSVVISADQEIQLSSGPGAEYPYHMGEDLPVHPVVVKSAKVESDDRGISVLELELSRHEGASGPWPEILPLFLLGDAPTVWTLRFALVRRTAGVEVLLQDTWTASSMRFGSLEAPGYDDAPHPHPFSDARDFLCSDERFRFVELSGLSVLPSTSNPRIRVVFDGFFPRAMTRGVDSRVFCPNSAIFVNRFTDSCDGFVWDHTRSRVPLHAPRSAEMLEVGKVEGTTRGAPGRRTRFHPLSLHLHDRDPTSGVYVLHRHKDRNGRPAASLSLGWPQGSAVLREESITVQAEFCDGDQPHDTAASLKAQRRGLPGDVEMRALTRPTPAYRPPAQVGLRTRLFTLLDIHFSGLLDAARLRDALRLFMWDPAEAKRTLVDSIQEVSVEDGHTTWSGIPWPERHVRIRLRDTSCTPDTWERLGLLDAFSRVLARLVEEETPLGSHSRTTVSIEPCGVELEFGPQG